MLERLINKQNLQTFSQVQPPPPTRIVVFTGKSRPSKHGGRPESSRRGRWGRVMTQPLANPNKGRGLSLLATTAVADGLCHSVIRGPEGKGGLYLGFYLVVLGDLTVFSEMEDSKETFSVREERKKNRQTGNITL